MKCKTCKRFEVFAIPPDDWDVPSYGKCVRYGRTHFASERDDCIFQRYRWRQLTGKLGRVKRRLSRCWRRFIYLLRWKIYYKVEHLWLRPKLCVVCGVRKGEYYYGAHKFPVEGAGKHVPVAGSRNTVRWVGKTVKIPHWECAVCFTHLNGGGIVCPNETQVGYGIAGV